MEKNLALEVNLIKDKAILEITGVAMDNAPKYFWTMPSSTTGKYHPEEESAEGGLVIHTKKVVYLARNALRRYNLNTSIDLDIITSAAIMHDMVKKGMTEREHTVCNHGEICAAWLMSKVITNSHKMPEPFRIIVNTISNHYGIWSPTYVSGKQFTSYELAIQEADYYSSRKPIMFNWELIEAEYKQIIGIKE